MIDSEIKSLDQLHHLIVSLLSRIDLLERQVYKVSNKGNLYSMVPMGMCCAEPRTALTSTKETHITLTCRNCGQIRSYSKYD